MCFVVIMQLQMCSPPWERWGTYRTDEATKEKQNKRTQNKTHKTKHTKQNKTEQNK